MITVGEAIIKSSEYFRAINQLNNAGAVANPQECLLLLGGAKLAMQRTIKLLSRSGVSAQTISTQLGIPLGHTIELMASGHHEEQNDDQP